MARGPLRWKCQAPVGKDSEDLDAAMRAMVWLVKEETDGRVSVEEELAAARVVKLARLDELEEAEQKQWEMSGPARHLPDGEVVPGSIAFRLRCAIAEGRVPTWFIRRLAMAALPGGTELKVSPIEEKTAKELGDSDEPDLASPAD